MVRQFLSAAVVAAGRAVAPPPKVKPWPFALGAASTQLLALWVWLLNEEARLARTVSKTERDLTQRRLDGIDDGIRSHTMSLNDADRRILFIDEMLTMPRDGETFAAFQRRAPRSRAASAAWWKEPVPGAVWTAETGRWVLAGEVRGFQRAEAERAVDPYDLTGGAVEHG